MGNECCGSSGYQSSNNSNGSSGSGDGGGNDATDPTPKSRLHETATRYHSNTDSSGADPKQLDDELSTATVATSTATASSSRQEEEEEAAQDNCNMQKQSVRPPSSSSPSNNIAPITIDNNNIPLPTACDSASSSTAETSTGTLSSGNSGSECASDSKASHDENAGDDDDSNSGDNIIVVNNNNINTNTNTNNNSNNNTSNDKVTATTDVRSSNDTHSGGEQQQHVPDERRAGTIRPFEHEMKAFSASFSPPASPGGSMDMCPAIVTIRTTAGSSSALLPQAPSSTTNDSLEGGHQHHDGMRHKHKHEQSSPTQSHPPLAESLPHASGMQSDMSNFALESVSSVDSNALIPATPSRYPERVFQVTPCDSLDTSGSSYSASQSPGSALMPGFATSAAQDYQSVPVQAIRTRPARHNLLHQTSTSRDDGGEEQDDEEHYSGFNQQQQQQRQRYQKNHSAFLTADSRSLTVSVSGSTGDSLEGSQASPITNRATTTTNSNNNTHHHHPLRSSSSSNNSNSMGDSTGGLVPQQIWGSESSGGSSATPLTPSAAL